jgi:hypothetical protein
VYGNFPSASVGWRISKRKVHGGIKLRELKSTSSWGITGNDRIPRNVWEQTYNPNQDYV